MVRICWHFLNVHVNVQMEMSSTMLSPGPSGTATEFETVIATGKYKYRIAGQAASPNSFTIRIINEDYTERWAGNYSANYIDDITQKAGCVKRISVFWRMLVNAVKSETDSVTLQILTEDEMEALSNSRIGEPDNRLYLLLTHMSEYDCFRYPLPVRVAPFTYEEYADTIKLLYEDNKNLQKALVDSDCTATIMSLETKVEEFTEMMSQLRKQKDLEIARLKRKIKQMKAKESESTLRMRRPSSGSNLSGVSDKAKRTRARSTRKM